MKRSRLVLASFVFHARSHVAVLLSSAAACAIVAGALLVGHSVRQSLRERALERLAGVEQALVSERFFRDELATDLAADPQLAAAFEAPVPAILLRGTVVRAEAGAGGEKLRATGVQIVAVDDRFSRVDPEWPSWKPEGRAAVVNQRLAAELELEAGVEVLVYFEVVSDVARETPLGEIDDTVDRLRLDVKAVRPDRGAALFDLRNQQATPRNIFVPLALVQRALEQEERANALLLVPRQPGASASVDLPAALKRSWQLADLKLRLRRSDELGYLALESEEFVLADELAEHALRAAREIGAPHREVLSYLVNSLEVGERRVPYSIVTAVGEWQGSDPASKAAGVPAPRRGRLRLVSWAAEDLDARVGDPVTLFYYSVLGDERLVENTETLRVGETVPLEGNAADPGWTPHYEGVTDASTFSDWHLPFEIDDDRIRPKDEEYWREHRTTPKAYINLADGERLWASRFGGRTSIRLRSSGGRDLQETERAYRRQLLASMRPASVGLRFDATRERALEAASGGTDFGVLFLSLSVFIIVSALILVAMTFRLFLERRAREFGMLRALGFARRETGRVALAEGLLVGGAGTLLGIALGVAYAALLIAGLKSFWSGAVSGETAGGVPFGAPFLELHVSGPKLAYAALGTLFLIAVTIALVVRRVSAVPPRRLLAGGPLAEDAVGEATRAARRSLGIAVGLACLEILLLVAAKLEWLPLVGAFVAQGICLFAAGLFLLSWRLRRPHASSVHGRGPLALLRLGAQNGRRAAGRSLLTAGLMASATFVVVTVALCRHDPESDQLSRDSGNGGFSVVATSTAPLYRSLETEEGREALGLQPSTGELLDGATRIVAFRERPGDETSCLNLYAPQKPRLLGAPAAFLRERRFAWAGSLARADGTPLENPWGHLDESSGQRWADDVIPAVGDQNTVQWILKSGLGQDIEITDDHGQTVQLRLVALLTGSIFQGTLVISEERFQRHFSRRGGWSTFLFETERQVARQLIGRLETDLEKYGLDAQTTGELLANYLEVQNTYLLTFSVLGGLGLLLGTLGLGATLLRNVAERRGELALLRALGFSRRQLGWLVLSESLALLFFGLVLGGGAAALATLPLVPGSQVSWGLLAGTLLLILLSGVGSCLGALFSALRTPLLPALRSE
ncbi:MAG: FtsX-like permease family protein [Planctomycetota bacterium]|nr:FtsX-like permease family protein [Planctomycetota bacterium]